MKSIKLLAFDIDGTLIPYGKTAISPAVKNAIQQAKEQGLDVLIATGRHFNFIHPSVFTDINPSHLVTINGGCLVSGEGEILQSHPMTSEDVVTLRDLCHEKNIGLGFKFKEGIVGYAHYAQFYKGYVGDNDYGSFIFENPEEEDFHITHGCPLGCFLIGDEPTIEALRPLFPHLTFGWSYPNGYDVYPTAISKATAIESYLKMKGYQWDEVMTFGDAANDIQMFHKSAIGVAMGNAKDNVKKEADFVSTSVHDDGVVPALKHFNIL